MKYQVGDLILGHREDTFDQHKEHPYIGYITGIYYEEEDPDYYYTVQWIYPANETERFSYAEQDVKIRLERKMWKITPVLR